MSSDEAHPVANDQEEGGGKTKEEEDKFPTGQIAVLGKNDLHTCSLLTGVASNLRTPPYNLSLKISKALD